jgi:hypothetical protein
MEQELIFFTGNKTDNKEVKDTIYSLISCSAATL